jgi:peptide/nickel transport system substrate-binding protein
VRSGQATLALLDARRMPEAKAAGLTVRVNEKNAFWVLYFNLTRAGLSDVRVRRAIMHAIDRDALADALIFGSGRATEQIFAAASPLNIKALDERYPFDQRKAKALLIAEALQSMLGEVGIRLKFDTVDVSRFPLFFQQPPRGDMMLGRFGGRSEPVRMPHELVATGGPFSPGGGASPEIDRLIGEAKQLVGTDPRHGEVPREVVDMASDAVSLVPIMTRANVYAFKPGCVMNLAPYLPGGADRFNDVRIGTKCR